MNHIIIDVGFRLRLLGGRWEDEGTDGEAGKEIENMDLHKASL